MAGGVILRGIGWFFTKAARNKMTGELFKNAAGRTVRNFSPLKSIFTAAGATAVVAKHEKIGSTIANVFSHPIDTAKDAGETIKSGYNGVLDFADGAEEKVENAISGTREKIETTSEFFNDPAGAVTDRVMDNIKDDDGGFDWWNMAKWGGGVGIGGWLLSKIFGGGDDKNKENDNDSGIGFGTIFKVGLLALTSWLVWSNRDKIMDMVSGNDDHNAEIDFMDPDSFELG